MILVIDNYDSFVYNLAQYIGEYYENIRVYRNNQITISEIKKLNPKGIIISPGPCGPEESGISIEIIKNLKGIIPIFGVCLGLQCIGAAFGANIKRALIPMHGKISLINHSKRYVFENVINPLSVVRYHSLVVDSESISSSLLITAKSIEGEIMGLKHKDYNIEGVQFHPESVFSYEGKKIIINFLKKLDGLEHLKCNINK